jgi:hypothetical protein
LAIPASRAIGAVLGKKLDNVADLTNRELAAALRRPKYAEKLMTMPPRPQWFKNAPAIGGALGGAAGDAASYYMQN